MKVKKVTKKRLSEFEGASKLAHSKGFAFDLTILRQWAGS